MQQLKRQIDEIDKQIGQEMGRLRSSVKAEYAAAQGEESALRQAVAELRGQAFDAEGSNIEYSILKRDVDTNRQLYDGLLQRYKEVGAATDTRANNITIVDPAQSANRTKPNLRQNLIRGLLLGALLGVLAAFLLDFLDDRLKSPQDVEQKLRLPVLGVIPKLGAKERIADVAGDPRSSFSEAYRSVRATLQFSTDHGVPRTLLVTSSGPGEGKSTAALTLARNFAQLGKSVLLIEADLRNPSLHRALGLEDRSVGLSNLLSGASTLTETLRATEYERLSVILAGPLPPNPAELLSGSKLVSLLTVSIERFDQIIIDGPPVLGLADAPILANVTDGTLLMVDAAKTRIRPAQAALKRLLAARARVVGALLSKYDAHTAGYGYGYGYGYQYGTYKTNEDKPRLGRS
ncbi:tyrosine-protein kinase [Thermomonas carbonis]|uniref:non-specific protein-tyrosine kinase n=2 Tax=Thermomonas carbonis TaxID=1463158 RepID=A0A7G9SN19_9GAMM|nr:tyrosine-protein kinase [Thermomonas carbonis]QNN69244.1 polysaccharide biosynthesis tyrosine autokinase [Thermomonas carbonis]